jgi:hypothetical protein
MTGLPDSDSNEMKDRRRSEEGIASAPHQYTALRTVGSVYYVLGWVVLIGGALFALGAGIIIGARVDAGGGAIILGLITFLGGSMLSAIIGLPLLAFSNLVALLVDIEENTRAAALRLGKLP